MSKRKKNPQRRASQPRSDTFFAMARRLRLPAGILLIAPLALACYFPSLSGGFIWDDDLLISGNRVILVANGLHSLWCTTQPPDYWPLTNSSFWIEWRLWGMNTSGYHLANLILHIIRNRC